jgi:hypothetical protein
MTGNAKETMKTETTATINTKNKLSQKEKGSSMLKAILLNLEPSLIITAPGDYFLTASSIAQRPK